MTTTQRVIKYCAIAFAVFLIVSIFTGILGAVSGLSFFSSGKRAVGESKSYTVTGTVESLEMELSGARLTVRTGDGFSVELANLKLDMGIGEVDMRSVLTGDCKIDIGVGELNLDLLGTSKDYSVALDKGIGDALLDGRKMQDDEIYGTGDTAIEIDGGVGAVKIEFDERSD